MIVARPRSTLFPYTTLFRSRAAEALDKLPRWIGSAAPEEPFRAWRTEAMRARQVRDFLLLTSALAAAALVASAVGAVPKDERSEEHTSELQSLRHLVCRLLL